ncbi:MAG: DUF3127 domain-containing protein [Prevotella sp.]|nr:DUF3127 domain-containing protein [Prevotella sp.]
MKVTARIISIGEQRKGENERGAWCAQDVEVTWKEEGVNGFIDHKAVISVSAWLDQDRLKKAIEQKEDIEVRMYFDTREYNNRKFNQIRGYLPEDFKIKTL